jgi:Flp pilus assembly protein TadD
MAEEAWEAVDRSDLKKAEELIRHALKEREGDCVLWNDLGLILWKVEKLREAERAFRTALLLRPEYEEGKMNLASLLASRGFHRQALRLEEELAESGLHKEFHQKRAEEYRAQADENCRASDGLRHGELEQDLL